MGKQKKYRVLALSNNLDEHAGWGRYSWNIIKRLIDNRDVEIRVLVARGSDKAVEEVCLPGSFNFLSMLRAVKDIRRAVKSVDIVHAFDGFPYGVLAYLGIMGMRNKRLIINGVGTYSVRPLLSPVKGWLLKKAYRRADHILCISNYTLSRIKKYVPELSNLSVVHLGVDANVFTGNKSKKKKNNSPHLLVTGEIKSRKGQYYTVRAVDILKKKYPDVKLTIIGYIGSGAYYKKIQDYIAERDLSGNIRFLRGITDEELAKEYQSADIYVMPSLSRGENFEGFGLVYLEAGLYGVPSIGSRNSGAEDAIIDGKTGYLIEQESAEEIARAVEKIFSRDNYDALSQQARLFAQKFTWDKTVAGCIQAYEHSNSK